MANTDRYEVNKPDVVEESIDGEALIVHLGTGAYYSARGAGDVAWRVFAGGGTVLDATKALAGGAGASEDLAEVKRFLDELVSEGLLRPRSTPAAALPPPATPAVFTAPLLEKFTDMQDLLLLDPIHDVDDATGWPHARPEAAGS